MKVSAHTEQARPLLEDWANELGLNIKWFHEWTHDGLNCVTAFACIGNNTSTAKINTVKWK